MQKKTVRVATNQPGVYKNLKTGKYDVKYRVWGFILYPLIFVLEMSTTKANQTIVWNYSLIYILR